MFRLASLIVVGIAIGILISFGIVNLLGVASTPAYQSAEALTENAKENRIQTNLLVGTDFTAPDHGNFAFMEQFKLKEEHLLVQLSHIQVVFSKTKEIRAFKTAVSSSTSRASSFRKFMTLNLNMPSGITVEQYKKVLGKTGLDPLIESAVHVEKTLGINSLYILAHAAEESKWGTSELARLKNNFFGYNAVDSDPSKAKRYASPDACVKAVMKAIKRSYLTKGGKYYNRRYGSTLVGMSARYASNPQWDENIAQIMYQIHRDIQRFESKSP